MRLSWFRHSRMGFELETALRHTRYALPTDLPHWKMSASAATSTENISSLVDAIIDRGPPATMPTSKGYPDVVSIKRESATKIKCLLAEGERHRALSEAHRLAAIDMSDGLAYLLFLDLSWLVSASALEAARQRLKPFLVMHLSCEPRIDRAIASCRSFESAEKEGVSQVVVVGSAESTEFRFDPDCRLLTVPAPDTYEYLPSKVLAAMFFFSLCGNVTGVLKVDDDHRLRQYRELVRGFSRMRYPLPLQLGQLTRVRALGLHSRVWHFGKASDKEIDKACFTFPGTTRWASGANGYFINKEALHLLLWSYVYFQDYIRTGLYEDVIVSDLIDRQGGRLAKMDMEKVLSVVDNY